MSEYIKLAKNGAVKYMINNTSLRMRYRCNNCAYRKKKELWEIIDEDTKEIVKTFDNAEDAEEFFYNQETIKNPLKVLRNGVILEKGFTVKNLFEWIEDNEVISALINKCTKFGYLLTVLGHHENVILQPTVNIEGDELKFYFDHINSETFQISPVCHVYDGDQKIAEYECNYSLLDVILGLTGGHTEKVRITKNGIVSNLESTDLFSFLLCPCEIDEDVTLGDLFKIVEREPLLCEFLKYYSWCWSIKEFHEAAKVPLKNKDDYTEKLWHLRVYRWLESFDQKSIDFFPSFDGIGEVQDKSAYNPATLPDFEKYGIELSPMNELVNLPLVADPVVKLRGKSYNMGYTLLDILDAVYWEISFFGGPDEASDIKSDLIQKFAAIKGELEGGSNDNEEDASGI